MKEQIRIFGKEGLLALLMTLLYQELFWSVFMARAFCHNTPFFFLLAGVILLAAAAGILLCPNLLFQMHNKKKTFRGMVYLLFLCLNGLLAYGAFGMALRQFDSNYLVQTGLAYSVPMIPVLLLTISDFTHNLTCEEALDSTYTVFPVFSLRRKLLFAGITLFTTMICMALAIPFFTNISALRQMPEGGVTIISVEKGYERVYFVTDDGNLYVNGSSENYGDQCAYGFSDNTWYQYRCILGKSRPVFVCGDVKNVFVISQGCLMLTKEDTLLFTQYTLEDYRAPVPVAERVIGADAAGNHIFYIDQAQDLYYLYIEDSPVPKKIMSGVEKIEINTMYVNVLDTEGNLYMYRLADLTSWEESALKEAPIARQVKDFSSKHGLSDLLYVTEEGNAYYLAWMNLVEDHYTIDNTTPKLLAGSAEEVSIGIYVSLIRMQDGSVQLFSNMSSFYEGKLVEAGAVALTTDMYSGAVLLEDGTVVFCGDLNNGKNGIL